MIINLHQHFHQQQITKLIGTYANHKVTSNICAQCQPIN